MALPFGTSHYGKKSERTKNPNKVYVSTHAIKITAEDMNWFAHMFMRPGEKTHTAFHRMRMELARLEHENKVANATAEIYASGTMGFKGKGLGG